MKCELQVDAAKRAAAIEATRPLVAAFPAGMSQPALRALAGAGIRRLDDLTRFSERQLRQLHGMGPKALGILAAALKNQGKSFWREGGSNG
jgi:hypothetical protein